MGVTNVDPGTLAATWAQRMGAATDRMKAGAQSITTSPGQAAAANGDAYLSGVQNSYNLWRQKVAAVSLSDWQNDYINKGLPRVAAGATAAQSKFATILGNIITAERSIVSSLPARGGLEANINRSGAFQRAMAAKKGTFS